MSSVTAAELRSKSWTVEEASDNILRGCCRSAARIADSDSTAADPPLRQSGLPWGTLAHWAPAAIDPATEPKPTIPPPLIDCLNGSPRWHPHCVHRFRIHESVWAWGLGAEEKAISGISSVGIKCAGGGWHEGALGVPNETIMR
uniref:Uncharacterized protein n=1 Tax=Oryza punctata TaxID=4537 RepID=A0A0E0M683_ORYPU